MRLALDSAPHNARSASTMRDPGPGKTSPSTKRRGLEVNPGCWMS